MKKSTLVFSVLTIIIGGAGLYAGLASAYQGDPAVKGPNYSADRHAAMEKAFENNDYNAWKSLMSGKGRVTQIINQDNFAKFAEAHALAEQGKTAEAQKIRQDLGLGLKNCSGQGMRGGQDRGMNR